MQATRLSRRNAAIDMALMPCALLLSILSNRYSQPEESSWRSVVFKSVSTRLTRVCAALVLMLLAMAPAAYSQTMSGQITGRLADPGGAIIAGARVQLTN